MLGVIAVDDHRRIRWYEESTQCELCVICFEIILIKFTIELRFIIAFDFFVRSVHYHDTPIVHYRTRIQ